MKRIINAVFGVFVSLMLITHSFIVYAIDFDAEKTFDSVVVVISGRYFGSGFALGDKCVITNAHVLQDPMEVVVTSYDGKDYPAIVYCKSDDLDIAVLYVPSATFTPLSIGDTSKIKIGDDVYAIGAPSGMSYTLTKGTLSSYKRRIGNIDYLQIDAALNSGNSGGPLLNVDGAVVGMNTMKISNSEGLGLAIPIECILQYLQKNGVSITGSGVAEAPQSQMNPASNSITQESGGLSFSEKENVVSSGHDNEHMLRALICVSIICNIIMLLLTLRYRSKCKRIKAEQSERTDFEIDIWE